jgi:hypothetical protein
MCGFGKDNCNIQVISNGIKEWWVQVKTAKGGSGWVCASKVTGDKLWDNPNFRDLCTLD